MCVYLCVNACVCVFATEELLPERSFFTPPETPPAPLRVQSSPGFCLSISSLDINKRSIACDDMYGLISKTSLVP